MTRRAAIGLLGAAFPLCAATEEKSAGPVLCVYSRAMAGVGYAELGDIVKQLGFDGVDLTVMPGGHVEPQLAPVDEVRALESIHGAGLKAPIITTALTTPNDMWCRTVLALAGRTGVGLFRSGLSPRYFSTQTRREAFGLSYIGKEYQIAITLPVGAGDDGFTPSQAKILLGDLDPKWSGLCLSSSCFAAERGLSDAELNDLLPRVTAILISDFVWSGQSQEWRPLGQGSVDFTRLFAKLTQAKFTGPLSVARDYKVKDAPGSLARDAEFIRKRMQPVS